MILGILSDFKEARLKINIWEILSDYSILALKWAFQGFWSVSMGMMFPWVFRVIRMAPPENMNVLQVLSGSKNSAWEDEHPQIAAKTCL